MTNDQSHRDFPHFHHFPPGSAPKIHNRLHAANLHQTTSPLPTQKPEKGSAAAADFPGFPLSALDFQNTTFDSGTPTHFPRFPKGSTIKIHNRLSAANLHQTTSPLPTQKSEKGSAAQLPFILHPSSFILRPSSFIPYLLSLIL
jgi:hypothetical protein